MAETNKAVFLQTLIVTIIVFIVGIVLGFALENTRVNDTELALLNSEISTLDEQIRSTSTQIFNLDCDTEVSSMFDFADRIYKEARLLEEYDSSNKFLDQLKTVHKKYDLLRTLLWIHSIETKEKCGTQFHTIIYFFDYASQDVDLKARQAAISRILVDLKGKYGNSILLIPIASNLELESIETVKDKYNIIHAPALIIDETKIITDQITLSQLEDIVFEQNDYKNYEENIYKTANLNEPSRIHLNSDQK